ncbi:G-type lectin S-receptor-like serine/threonine-protein kinase LECRK2 [Macadamia integrifolia]|uniref:G-type lectin S-receptor-like serine/threonine-protein kinase LECRK2 n=1 Tax=Macadamia integrifolia TaxID=60698 RepID=UPI001C4F3D4B|nr:G-type lectin S-receptor-like serine/threonine-protein kinase LECRK2 [Macadamia integrifolia]
MSSNAAFPHILFFSSLLFPLFLAASQASNVTFGNHLIAADGGSPWTSLSCDFAFGFPHLEDNNSFLLCIWFYQIPKQTIVWYVNGTGNPAPKNSKIELTTGGQLQLTDPTGQELWKAEIINSSNVAYAAMLGNGNFVLESKDFVHIWETFNQPTDTILPGQKLQVGRNLSSRLTNTNYSQGRFQLQLLQDGTLQINLVALPSYTPYDPYFTIGANPPDNRSRLVFNVSGRLYIKRSNGSIDDLSPINTYPVADFYHRATLDVHGAFYLYTHPRAVNGIPARECPPEYSQIDSNSSLSGCKPNIPLVCEEDESGFPEALFEFTELSSTDWPLADYERLGPVTEEHCKNSSEKVIV